MKRISLTLDPIPADELARKAERSWRKRVPAGSSKGSVRPQLSEVSQSIEACVAQLEHIDPDLKEVLLSLASLSLHVSLPLSAPLLYGARVRAWRQWGKGEDGDGAGRSWRCQGRSRRQCWPTR